jgi:hypothetical protein
MVNLPPEIADPEALGRAVFDGKKARRAARDGQIAPRVFEEKAGVRELSVDRLSFGDHDQIAHVQDEERGQPCLGWAWITAEHARKGNRKVLPDPVLPHKPYHANIILPEAPEDEFLALQKEHATEMAMAAKWLPRPSSKP